MEGAIATFMLHMATYWSLIGYYGDPKKKGYKEACYESLKNQILILSLKKHQLGNSVWVLLLNHLMAQF